MEFLPVCQFDFCCVNRGWRCQFCNNNVVINGEKVRRFTQFKDREYYRKTVPITPNLKQLFQER